MLRVPFQDLDFPEVTDARQGNYSRTPGGIRVWGGASEQAPRCFAPGVCGGKRLWQARAEFRPMLGREAFTHVRCGQSDDHREGVTALVEKRQPQFKGCQRSAMACLLMIGTLESTIGHCVEC